MNKNMKKIISLLVAVALLFSVMPMAFGNTAFTDFPIGWSAEAMAAAVSNGLLSGYEDGTVRPEKVLTRAEVATIITRAFGATTVSDISAFRDVPADAWFAPYIARAVMMGALSGTGATTMEPDMPITREQVFTAVARVLVLSDSDISCLSKFNDAGSISSWATNSMAALVKRGYINGDNFGNVNPKAYITREEFAQFMHNAIRTYITKKGTYSSDLDGITVIRVPDVSLRNLWATSDIVIGDGVGKGNVFMNNVSIEKRLLARGGTVSLVKTTTGDGVVVNNVNGVTHFNNYRYEPVFAGIVENTVATFLNANLSFGDGGGAKTFTLKFYLHATDSAPYKTVSIKANEALGTSLPTIDAEDVVGYKFLGWHKRNDPGAVVDATTQINGNMDIVANLELINYPVSFLDEDGVSPFPYFDGYTPAATVNVKTAYAFPADNNIKRNGYTFGGWVDALGNPVTALTITATTPSSGFALKPVFTKDTYNVEFYDGSAPATFVPGYTAPTTFAIDSIPALPTADKVIPQSGIFAYWKDQNGAPVYSLVVTDEMGDGDTVKLYLHTTTVPVTTYDLNFYLHEGDTVPYKQFINVVENTTLGISFPTVNAADIVGFAFEGWYVGSTKIDATTPINGNWNPVAKLTLKEYPVKFLNEDGTTAFSYFDGYTPATSANVNATYVMPLPTNVKRLGYTFNGWKDALGNPVSSINITATTPDSGFELIADFTKNTYYVEFYYEDQTTPVTFVSGYTAPYAYDVDHLPVLPTADKVVVPAGRYFVHWTNVHGNHVSGLSVVSAMPNGNVVKLYAKTEAVPVTTYDLNFYLRAGDATPYRILTGVVEGDSLGADLPVVNAADIVGFAFDGWYVGTTKIDATTPINGNWNPVAKLTLKEYPVKFLNEDGTTAFSYFDGYTPAASANVNATYVMPLPTNVKRLGYTFNGWKDAHGNPVTAINITATTPDSGFELIADFTKNTYYVEFYYEDNTPVSFVSGYTAPYAYAVDNIPVLPSADKVIIPAGEFFVRWEDEHGNAVAGLSVDGTMPNGNIVKLYAATDTVPPTLYDLNFYLRAGDVTPYATRTGVVSGSALGLNLPTVNADDIVGYQFRGWYNGTMPVTADTPIIGNWDIIAELELIEYPVKFLNEDGTTAFSYFDGYTPAPTANYITSYVMPLPANIKRAGYTFNGWKDALGNPVSSINITASTPLSGFELIADFTKHTYYVEFYNADNTPASFVSGYTAPYEYSVDNLPALPNDTQVVTPVDELFMYWVDENDNPVYGLTVTEDMTDGQILKLFTYNSIIPPDTYTVTFYDGYGALSTWMKNVVVTENETVPTADIPATGYRKVSGYKENGTIASVYEGNEYTHVTVPTYWYLVNTYACASCGHEQKGAHVPEACANCAADSIYLNASGKSVLTPFDETVVIEGDLDVYLLYQRFGIFLNYPETDLALAILAAYDGDTRLMDTYKDLLTSGRRQLSLALALDQVPKYDTTIESITDKLLSVGLIDENGNIQILNLPIGISTLVKEDTANKMVKQYIRDVVNDPARLDSLLQMVDLATLVQQMDVTAMINSLSDQQIADIITDPANQEAVINAVVTDLGKIDSKMRSMIIDSLVSDLKNGAPNASVLNYIRTSDELIDMIVDALAEKDPTMISVMTDYFQNHLAGNTDLLNALTNTVQTDLRADTADGAKLREAILTSAELPDLLKDSLMKNQIIDLLLDSAFVDKVLADNTFRADLLEAAIEDEKFVNYLVDTSEFANFILPKIRNGGVLAADILALLNGNGAFVTEMLADVKGDDTFLNLIAAGGALRNEVLNGIELSDYIVSTNDLLRYVFNQSGVTGDYSFISATDLNNFLEDEYNARYDESIKPFGSLSAVELQNLKTELYGDPSVHAAAIAEIETRFGDYKVEIIDKLAAKQPMGDARIGDMIDDALVDYLEDYINDETSLNASAESAIETIMLSYIRELLLRDTITDGALAAFKGDVIALKTTFVADAGNLTTISAIIKNFIATDPTETRVVVSSAYDDLAGDLVTLIQTNDSVYADVENELKNVTVSASVLSKFIVNNSTSQTVIDLLSDYFASAAGNATKRAELEGYIAQCLPTVTDGDLKSHIATFMTEAENETLVRSKLLTYINTYLGTDQLRTNIAEFLAEVDADFVHTNRTMIVAALDGVDLASFIDAQMVKKYINEELPTEADKNAFADDVFASLKNSADYTTFMHSLMHKPTFEVNASNVGLLQAVSGAVRDLDYDFVMTLTDNAALTKIIDVMGDAFLRDYFETMKNDYCNGFDEAITRVKNGGAAENYTTSLTLRFNFMNLMVKLYEKAKPALVERLENAGIRYDENVYLKWLVEHDVVSALFNGNKTLATGTSTGYAFKDTMDYYDYILSLVTVADDAICWYGDTNNVTEEEMDAVLDAVFGKIYLAHSKLNEILEAYESENVLPAKVESLVGKVKQVNGILTRFDSQIKGAIRKYLNSDINDKLEDADIHYSDPVQRVIDLLIGTEEPTFTIDSLYTILYRFDANAQKALKKVIESGALRKAIDRFESTDIGSVFKGNGRFASAADILEEIRNNGKVESAIDSIYDLLVVLSEEGIEHFRTEKDDVTVTDAYTFKVAGFELIVKRFYK